MPGNKWDPRKIITTFKFFFSIFQTCSVGNSTFWWLQTTRSTYCRGSLNSARADSTLSFLQCHRPAHTCPQGAPKHRCCLLRLGQRARPPRGQWFGASSCLKCVLLSKSSNPCGLLFPCLQSRHLDSIFSSPWTRWFYLSARQFRIGGLGNFLFILN